jgi:hypothetical protein
VPCSSRAERSESLPSAGKNREARVTAMRRLWRERIPNQSPKSIRKAARSAGSKLGHGAAANRASLGRRGDLYSGLRKRRAR